jgi:hypothetical protein
MTQHMSPLDRLQNELASEVSSGQISSADKDALSAALDSIDTAMKGQRPAGGGKPPSPDEMQSKISDLIQSQVDSGALTSDQANELKSVFANAMPKGGPGGPGGAGGPPPTDGTDQSSDTSQTSDSSSSDDDVAKLLSDFLQSLQDSNSSTSYSQSGDTLLSQISSLVVDYKA